MFKIPTSSAVEKSIAELVIIFLFMSFFIVYTISDERSALEESLDAQIVSESTKQELNKDYQDGFFARLYAGISEKEFRNCMIKIPEDEQEGYSKLAEYAFYADLYNDFSNIDDEKLQCIKRTCGFIFEYIYSQKDFVSEVYLIGRSSSDWVGSFGDQCHSIEDCNMYLSLNRSRNIFLICREAFFDNHQDYRWFDNFVIPTGRGSVLSFDQNIEADRRVDVRVRFNKDSINDQ